MKAYIRPIWSVKPKRRRMSGPTGFQLSVGPGALPRPHRALVTKQPRVLRAIYASAGSRAAAAPRTSRPLAYLAEREWLARIRRGLYAPVPLDAAIPSEWREDAWLVALHTFEPCYIGGWKSCRLTACEHWHLTEQIFRGSSYPLRVACFGSDRNPGFPVSDTSQTYRTHVRPS